MKNRNRDKCKRALAVQSSACYASEMYRKILLLSLLLAAAIPAVSAGEGAAETAPGISRNATSLPLTRVTLYTAGLAQMVHETSVDGNQVLSLYVDPSDINDLLKSMILEDLDGGSVEAVSFESSDPLSVSLGDLRLNPSGAPDLADFIERSQGETLRVLSGGAVRSSGRVFSVERFTRDEQPRIRLNLLGSEGLQSIVLVDGDSLLYEDPMLQAELEQGLNLIADSRRKSVRRVDISFTGTGRRRIRISYIREVPLWKTSYRMVIDAEGNVRLEGWALVQNTGGMPWDHVTLSFVAGSPNAFTMDLATPRYVHRKEVEIAAAQPLGPAEYAKGVSSLTDAPMRSRSESGAAFNNLLFESEELAMAPAPVESRAGGVRQGNFYRYEVKGEVSVPARSSAMIPVLVTESTGRGIGIYDPEYNAVFKGLQLENSSDAQWAAGPVSVFEGRSYAGDALLPEMIPGSSRMLNYALHGSLEVDKQQQNESSRITALKIANGVLQRSDKMVRETVYTITGEEKELIIIHPKASGWRLTEHPEIQSEADDSYRFVLTGWDNPVHVREERIYSRSYGLLNLKDDDIQVFLHWEQTSPQMVRALDRLSELRGEVEALRRDAETLEASLSSIERDQSRVRENMRVLDKDSDLFRQYSQRLGDQEEEIDSLNGRMETLRVNRAAASKELAEYAGRLEIN